MKILFAGCSFVMGAEILRHQRFSSIISKELNADEINIAYGGRSNNLSALLAITESEKLKPDYIVFGLTYPTRTVGLADPTFCFGDDKSLSLAEWVNDEYRDNDDIFQITSTMVDPSVIDYKRIESLVPIFRNDLAIFLELMGTIKLLESYSQTTGIPLCIFQAITKIDAPVQLNNLLLADTIYEYPPASTNWLDDCLGDISESINDLMPNGHPGPYANKIFADKLLHKIKQDLQI